MIIIIVLVIEISCNTKCMYHIPHTTNLIGCNGFHIPNIYPKELQLNKANTSNKETSFLDLNIKITGSYRPECPRGHMLPSSTVDFG